MPLLFGWPHIEERVSGFVDGSNQVFETVVPYQAGSLQVLLNGVLKDKQRDDGWDEIGGKLFRMKKPPQPGDFVGAYYRVGA